VSKEFKFVVVTA